MGVGGSPEATGGLSQDWGVRVAVRRVLGYRIPDSCHLRYVCAFVGLSVMFELEPSCLEAFISFPRFTISTN